MCRMLMLIICLIGLIYFLVYICLARFNNLGFPHCIIIIVLKKYDNL